MPRDQKLVHATAGGANSASPNARLAVRPQARMTARTLGGSIPSTCSSSPDET